MGSMGKMELSTADTENARVTTEITNSKANDFFSDDPGWSRIVWKVDKSPCNTGWNLKK